MSHSPALGASSPAKAKAKAAPSPLTAALQLPTTSPAPRPKHGRMLSRGHNPLSYLLCETHVGDIAPERKDGTVVFTTADELQPVVKGLSGRRILSAPLVNARKECVGFVDMLDIARYIVKVAPDIMDGIGDNDLKHVTMQDVVKVSHQPPDPLSWGGYSPAASPLSATGMGPQDPNSDRRPERASPFILDKPESGDHTPRPFFSYNSSNAGAGSRAPISAPGSGRRGSGSANARRRGSRSEPMETQVFTVHDNLPAIALVRLFSQGTHRVAVLNKENKIVTTCSQSDVVRYLYNRMTKPDHASGSEAVPEMLELAHKKVSALGYRNHETPVVTVQDTAPVLKALQQLYREEVDVVGVVDEHGKLVANFSASDLRGLYQEHFSQFLQPVKQFLKRHSVKSLEVRSFSTDQTLLELMKTFVELRLHHVWVTDAKGHPEAVIKLTDVMRIVAFHNVIGPPPVSPRRSSGSSNSTPRGDKEKQKGTGHSSGRPPTTAGKPLGPQS